mgnify:CR=1 FL=1
MIVLVAGLSVIVAYFAANTLIGKPTTQDAKVRTIDSITSTVTEPDTKVFNKEAINPTVEVNIGDE